MRELRRNIYDKGPVITSDLFMGKAEEVDFFVQNKFSLGTSSSVFIQTKKKRDETTDECISRMTY